MPEGMGRCIPAAGMAQTRDLDRAPLPRLLVIRRECRRAIELGHEFPIGGVGDDVDTEIHGLRDLRFHVRPAGRDVVLGPFLPTAGMIRRGIDDSRAAPEIDAPELWRIGCKDRLAAVDVVRRGEFSKLVFGPGNIRATSARKPGSNSVFSQFWIASRKPPCMMYSRRRAVCSSSIVARSLVPASNWTGACSRAATPSAFAAFFRSIVCQLRYCGQPVRVVSESTRLATSRGWRFQSSETTLPAASRFPYSILLTTTGASPLERNKTAKQVSTVAEVKPPCLCDQAPVRASCDSTRNSAPARYQSWSPKNRRPRDGRRARDHTCST